MNKFTLVQIVASDSGRPTVQAWSPAAYEEPALTTGHKVLGVTMTDAASEEPVAVMKRGYLRDVARQNNESWAVGEILYGKSDGTITNTRPAGPLPQVIVGTVFETVGVLHTVDVDVRVLPSISELSGVTRETLANFDVLIYNGTSHTWDPRQIDHGGDLAGLLDDDHPQYQIKHGFVRDSAGNHLVTLAYNATSRVVTVSPTGANFTVYVNGTQYIKTGAQAASAHGNTTEMHYITYLANGALATSNTAWSITDLTQTPVALVYYRTTGPVGICFAEYHESKRNLALHYNLHFTQGTKFISGGALSGYIANSDTDANVTFAVASTTIADEDIKHILTAISDGGPYTVLYRTGASGEWAWDSTPTYPFLSGTTYPQYNNVDAGGAGVWGMTELVGTGGGNWVNYYLCAIPSITAATQLVLISGQNSYSSLSAAQAASMANLTLGILPFDEIAPLYKITFHARSTYGGTHKAQIQDVVDIKTNGVSITQSATSPAIHNSLSGRSATDVHPASSVTFTPYSTLAATDVQSAIQELLDETAVPSLDGLSDVVIANATTNHALIYNGTMWVNQTVPGGATDLDGLSDVVIANATTNHALVYNGTMWVNQTVPGGTSTVYLQARFNLFSPPAGSSFYPLIKVSAAVSVVKVRCIHTGSGSVNVNVKKNHRVADTDILASDLTSASTWQNAAASGGSVSLSVDDELDVELASVTGYVEQIVVIVDYEVP